MKLTREQAQEIAREALTRLTKCGAVNISSDLSQDEYDNYVEELLGLIADSAQVVINGEISE